MAWRQIHIGQILESIGHLVSFDYMKNLTKNTFRCIANWMGRVARARREIVKKRLRRRRKRLDSRKTKRNSCRCDCVKCSSYRYAQRKRVLEPDYLDNLAYDYRINQEYPIINEQKAAEFPEPDVEIDEKREDNRDLQRTEYDDVVWWTNVIHRAQMPPLLNNLPTRSNCSSTSGFRSGTLEIFDSSEPSINTSSSSDSSCYESCRESSSSPRNIHAASKSESRMRDLLEDSKTRATCASRSASMPLGHWPNNQTSSLLASKSTEKSNKRKKRPVSSKTTTSHVCDRLSTCVRCSKINSRLCKRITR